MYRKNRHIHFVGIGGSGMSGIAELLLNLGHTVTGSDQLDSSAIQRLTGLGAVVSIGHSGENVKGAEVVVISSAVGKDNTELIAAREQRIPVIQRAEMLAELMRLKYGIAICGSHGKTTTTSLIGSVVASGGFDPTIVVGGRLNSIGTGASLGKGDFLIAEADESDGSFLRLTPTMAVVTNIDAEHLDYYGNLENVRKTFLKFINHLPFYGAAILCVDNENIREIIRNYEKRCITYGFSEDAEIMGTDVRPAGADTSFTVMHKGKSLGRVKINLTGEHNVANSLAAVSVGIELGLPFEKIKLGLESFTGVERRFQIKGEKEGVLVIDDYGHHPTEIAATLYAARKGWPDRRILTVFQPHRYTRTRDILGDFSSAFINSDMLIITSIYPAGEKPIPGITSDLILNEIQKTGHGSVKLIQELDCVLARLKEISKPGDIIITMGAGNIWKLGEEYLAGKN